MKVNIFLSAKRVFCHLALLLLLASSLPLHATENQTATPSSALIVSGGSTVSIPDGFVQKVIKKGETLSKICNADSTARIIFMKVNRVDERHFPAGREALVPIDVNKAMRYTPVPETLADSRGEREIRIFIDLQYFGAYEGGKLLFWGPVSSGKKQKPTPPGKYFVNYKERFRRSLKYENAPMPFSINYNRGFFIHQQSLPGRPASHGCVRLLQVDAERLFFWSQRRDPVTVVTKL